MKKAFLLFSVLYLGLVICKAEAKSDPKKPKNNSLLWKISGNNLKTPSFLLGTIHLICPDDFLWTKSMQKALDLTDQIVFEMDMDDPSLQGEVSAGVYLPEGKTLKDYYSEEEYLEVNELFQKYVGMPLDMMSSMQPLAVMSILTMKTLDCSVPISVEGKVMEMAAAQNKEILGLETAEDQLKVFHSMNTDSMAKQLLIALKDWGKMKKQYQQMLQYYKLQDMQNLYDLILESPDFKDNLNTLLFDRNQKWIPKMEHLAFEKATFFAVGAGHLMGDQGIIHLLRVAGYTVEMIK